MSENKSQITTGEALPEAPASASAKMISPNGIEWLLTTRDFTVNGLLKKIEVMESHLLKDGWTPAGYRSGNGNGASASKDAPICSVHNKPMKRSQFEGWYCPRKNSDGSYCKEKVE